MEPFSQEEIKAAMFSMKPTKSPGPDGISPVFLQKQWNVVKNFLSGGHMLRGTNQTFIALIPKVDRPGQSI